MELKVKRLTDILAVPALAYSTEGSSGLDLYAAISRPVLIMPGEHVRIPTGYAVEIPEGYEGQVRARSGLAAGEHKVGLTNGVGTIDADYRGEIAVLLASQAKADAGLSGLWITPGAKIAQLVILPIAKVVPVEVDELSETDRGEGGFGSTGNAAPSAAEAALIAAQQPAPVVAETPKLEDDVKNSAGAAEGTDGSAVAQDNAQSQNSSNSASDEKKDVVDPNAELNLYDTVNKVIFTGHPSKETETVVAITDEEATAFIADGAQDRRAK